MVAIYGGQESVPGDPVHPVAYTAPEVSTITQAGVGPSPVESQQIVDASIIRRKEEAERERLRVMEAKGIQAHEEYYAEGGTGYGTVPGGPDVTYMPSTAPMVAQTVYGTLDPYYEAATGFVEEKIEDKNLLLYGALAIGALALLKR